MAKVVKSAIFFAKVATSDISNALRVGVPMYKMDERLTMYFEEHSFLYAEDPTGKCKEGDYVIVRELPPNAQNKNITHVVEQLVFERGNFIDPLTGKKCSGSEFIEDIKRTSALFGIERPYHKSV